MERGYPAARVRESEWLGREGVERVCWNGLE